MYFLRLYHFVKTWFAKYRPSASMTATLLIVTISVANTGLMLLLKHFGKTQLLELIAYDRAVYARRDQETDSRLLVIGVTEHYINQTGKINPSDQDMVTVLDQLSRYDPVAIGVDLYRNAPQEGRDRYRFDGGNPDLDPTQFPNWQLLLQRLQQSHIVSIKTFPSEENVAIPSPPGVPPEQVGFNDLLLDVDRVVRRSLLMGWATDPNTGENQSFHFSLAMTLAIRYLEVNHGIQPQNYAENPDYLQLGEAVFVPLTPDAGGYDRSDAAGYQFFLNYHSRNVAVPLPDPAIEQSVEQASVLGEPATGCTPVANTPAANTPADSASSSSLPSTHIPPLASDPVDPVGRMTEPIGIPAVSFCDVLEGNITPEQVEGRIVLIGSTAPSLKDLFS
ncbi:MAG: CHASE2 domain-containing protein, partial [Cyanothece sp. SIO2G6]|nr:CHASE2 domain-containing protein [Cyanothece sp. SIO2G6]